MEHGHLTKNLVSVVVTCYNHENFIVQCLNSIYNQTYSNIELLVFNDGSTDGSGELIKTILKSSPYERTVYIEQDNQGIVPTRNQALDMVEGAYLLFVDSDNFLESNYIERLLEVSKSKNSDIVYTKLINPINSQVVVNHPHYSLEEFYRGNFIDNCSLIKRAIIDSARYDEYYNHQGLEDYDFLMNLIVNHDAKVSYCGDTHLNYRILGDSLSRRGDYHHYFELYSHVLQKYSEKHPSLALKASTEHMVDLTKMDIEHSIKKEKIQVFLSSDLEHPLVSKKIAYKDIVEIPLESFSSHFNIRVKPSNIPSFYKDFRLYSQKTKTEFLPKLSNGIINGNTIVFKDFYPFVDYDISLIANDSLILEYERYNISDITASNYIGKEQAESLYAFKQNERLIEQQLLSSKQEVASLQETLATKNKEMSQIQEKFNLMTHSRRWRYTSKIIDLFRRKK